MTLPPPEPRYEVARKGSPLGIHSLPELSQLISNGTLVWSDDCWTEGMESWRKLSDLREPIEGSTLAPEPTGSSGRALTYLSLVAAFVAVGGLTAYFLGSVPESAESASTAPTSASASAPRTPQQKALRLSLSEVQQQITLQVASSFVEQKDELTGQTYYVHRYYQNIGNRIPLRVFVNAAGQRNLYTYYQGKTWVFHNQLRFSLDRQTLETRVIPAYKASREISEGNLVTESCHFLGEEDEKLVGRLAAASLSQINIQMLGRKPIGGALSYETKQAIKQSYELAELLSKRHKLLQDLTPTH